MMLQVFRKGTEGVERADGSSLPTLKPQKMVTVIATLLLLTSVVAGQTNPSPPPKEAGQLAAPDQPKNQTDVPAAAANATSLPGSASTSLSPTNASYVDASGRVVNAPSTVDNATVAPPFFNASGPTTTPKMEMTYIARMPSTQQPTDPPQTPSESPIDEPENQLVNSTVFDTIVRQMAEFSNMNYSNPKDQCAIRSHLEPVYFNFEAEDGGTYCPSWFDEIQCWQASPPGEIIKQCPELVNGIEYNTNDTVTRICHFNGSWGNDNKSDYSQCEPILNYKSFDHHERAADMIIYIGYILSFTTLLGAFFILIYFKSLRCVRNYIHLNLVASFLLLYSIFFLMIIIGTASTATDQAWYCRFQGTSVVYITLTNFFWMFVEGLYLHTMVVRALTVRREKFWVYCVIGWGLPVVFAVAHAITMTMLESESDSNGNCLSKNEADYIVRIPIMLVISVNVFFMIHIIIILVTKLRASVSFETQQYRKGVRGIIVLLPLLGAAYFMLLLAPNPDKPNASSHVYRYLNAFLQSTQGFFVAIIYVYMNQEVKTVIKRRFRRWREESTLPTRYHSRKGSHSRHNSLANNLTQFRKGSQEDHSLHPSNSVKSGKGEVHVGNGKVSAYEKREELLPLQPVPEACSTTTTTTMVDAPRTPPHFQGQCSPPGETTNLCALEEEQSPALANHLIDQKMEEEEEEDGELLQAEDVGHGIDENYTPDDHDHAIGVGSDEALIVHGNTPVMEQDLFLQDKLTRDNNNVQRNGVKVHGSDENLLAGQVGVLNASQDRLSNADPARRGDALPDEGNENNSNNTQLPRILKTARERPHGATKKHVAFVCPETGADFHMHPQQFFVELDFDSSFATNQAHGLSRRNPDYTCSTIASDPWSREGDRSKFSPKILFKRPKGHGSPTAQKLATASGEAEGRNGRIKLPKSPAGTPV